MAFSSCLKTGFLVFGLLLIGFGVLLKWSLFPSIVNTMIEKQLRLDPVNNQEVWDTWVEPSSEIPVYMKFTFFNVTNTEEIKEGATPEVAEIGPFAYKETRRKVGVQMQEDEITYGSYISYDLDESASCAECTKDAKITVINPALVGVVAMIETLAAQFADDPILSQLLPAIYEALDGAITGDDPNFKDDLFSTQTANELVFEGYKPGALSAILYLLNEFAPYLPDDVDVDIPDIIADGKFAFFKGKNGTADLGWYKINSGLYNMNHYQKILEYNGQPSLPESWWGNLPKTPSANRSGVAGNCHDLAGTDGTQYPPNVDKEQDLWLFSSDLCRSIYLSYSDSVDMDGIETYQFSVKPEVLSFSNPENACYCPNVEECVKERNDTDGWDFSECRYCRDGMLDLTGCQGAPVIISLPHFLNADEETVSAINGMNPDESKHKTFLNIEPMTGVALDAHKRIQVNVPLMQNDQLTYFKNVKSAIFPVVWVDEGASIGGDELKELKKQLVTPFLGVDIGVGFSIGIGALIIIVLALMSMCSCGSKKKQFQKV
eukprot:TRINITY_DN4740_c0_g1_i3.p1 TRINITY_DN4740_c0_g1~~TRINITY_DN4740_c0_g1_i3.p1  ORF type:complete len:556 (-),score=84.27 TRINITY_DN4740_c0_g1_i3:103-1743(-)